MNIAILNYHRIGGSGIVAYEIGRSMAENRGHQVHFIGLEAPFRLGGQFSENIRFHKVSIKEYPVFDYQPYALALASQLSELIHRYEIDVVHSHYALPHAISAHLAREISGKPVKTVTTLHGTDITVVGVHPTMKHITRYAIEVSDEVTAVSDFLKKETEERFDIPKGKINTIYNFINPEFFNPELTKIDTLCTDDKFIAIHVSNLRPVKSPLDVIKIFNGLMKLGNRPMELWIVGEGPLQLEMISLAQDLGIDKSIRFLGVCNNVGPLIRSAQLMILPSAQESFGLAALEAMACGVPVLAANSGGLPELIDDGTSGILFEKGNVAEAIQKTKRFINDEQYYNNIRMNALDVAHVKFKMSTIIDQYEALYK